MRVKMVVAEAHELKPDKKYLIALDDNSITMEDAETLLKELKKIGVTNSVAIVTKGKPRDVLKIIEQEL